MKFCPERLITVRENLGINKADAARRLNISAMAYGRYEKGEREPSFQTVSYIAQEFNTTTDYLYGQTDEMTSQNIIISKNDDEELYDLVKELKVNPDSRKAVLAYLKFFLKEK
ncbi:DNA-binding transcriptional regulator, XRE-family HTH domain [Pseudobutyrivibrio sp. YE44]|uniref:helix-turn-helix domain-containing protein n=1 Tax=Pseudobutyrivibrio sp. YE44 TaxID=1520802 RepID=UPI00087F1C88|nr:helix-turn-helix transcriptional regulator [Pseudobutyrivibrio sp. YE44]SDB07840.1 DNA-binding transcriptional regulator, XRE-family HTH domain [Pseudobutyrivibrio sp. YE44]